MKDRAITLRVGATEADKAMLFAAGGKARSNRAIMLRSYQGRRGYHRGRERRARRDRAVVLRIWAAVVTNGFGRRNISEAAVSYRNADADWTMI